MTLLASDRSGGEVYAKWVADQFAIQDGYKESLEQRAMAVISSSSTLAALLFGFMAIVTRLADFHLPVEAALALVVSIALFALAAVSAIFVNRPRDYAGVKIDPVKSALEEWTDDLTTAQQKIALTQVEQLRVSRAQNTKKGEWLVLAVASEAFAVVGLAAAVALAILQQENRSAASTHQLVATIGLLLDIVGAIFVVKGLLWIRDDELAEASDSSATWADSKPTPRPALLNMLKDSRRDARIGAGLLVLGFSAQLLAVWL